MNAEALKAVLDYLFMKLGKHRVYGSVDPGNAPSLALLERVGMRREAHFVESLWFKGAWADDPLLSRGMILAVCKQILRSVSAARRAYRGEIDENIVRQ